MTRPGVLFLMYHAILAPHTEPGALSAHERAYAFSLDDFRRHLDLLSAPALGDPVAPCEALSLAPDGGPGRDAGAVRVCLTFDDALAQHAEVAMPELAGRGFPAAVFVTTGEMDSPGRLSWSALGELRDAGWLIGAHGHSHRFLPGLPEAELDEELARAKGMLEERTGGACEWLSLPGGRGDARVVSAARRNGYRGVFGSMPGIWTGGTDEPLPRVVLRPDTGGEVLRRLLADPASALAVLARSARRRLRIRRWIGDRAYHGLHRWFSGWGF